MKRYLHLSLIVIFPYLILFAILCMPLGYFKESLFRDYGFYLLRTLLILYLAAFLFSVATLAVSIIKKWSGEELLRVNLTVKLLHIPVYVFAFIIGMFYLFILFSSLMYENYRFTLTIILMVLNCMTIFLTGLIGLGGVIRGFKENKLSKIEVIVHGFFQFVLIADVISSIIVYNKTKC